MDRINAGKIVMSLRIVLAVLCVLLFSGRAEAQKSDEKLRLIRAETSVSTVEKGQIVRRLVGDVLLRQGELELSCDEATEYTRDGRTVFSGRVHIRDAEQELWASRAVYYKNLRLFEAEGDVKIIDKQTTMTADKVAYLQDERRIVGTGHVVVDNREEHLRLSGGRLDYLRGTGYVNVTREPVLIQFDSTGVEEMRITGEQIEAFDNADSVVVRNDVIITRGETVARCGTAIYTRHNERITLLQEPQVLHEGDRLAGERIDLYLQERKLREVHVSGKAEYVAESDSTLAKSGENKLTGQDIRVFLRDDQVEKVVVNGTATSIWNIVDAEGNFQGLNWTQGDRITIYIENKALSTIYVDSDPGLSRGKFTPPGFSSPAKASGAATDTTSSAGKGGQ